MSRETTPSFVTELPLLVTPKQAHTLRVRLEFARQLYNACLGEGLTRLALMHQSKAYQSARYIPKDESHKKDRQIAFSKMRQVHEFRDYDIQAYAATIKLGWIGSSVAQKVATRAFNAVSGYAFGKYGKPRFKGAGQFDSVEGKQNTVISWNGKAVVYGGLVLPAILSKDDKVIQHGLGTPIKYVRLVRRNMSGKNKFYAQLVCKGLPYQKEKNKIGKGLVGLDIGPSTLAITAPHAQKAELHQFCNELKKDQQKIRRQQRKLDRQRRDNNPQNYSPNGTIKSGKKEWHKSKGYEETRANIAENHRKLAEHRKSLHGQMVNHIFSLGNEIKLEKLSYRAFQKIFGKSVGMRAPGTFVSLLKRKAESAGVSVTEFPTRTTKLSQGCLCGQMKKKPLSERWHICDCGVVAQRDLFSAFLASCVEDEKLNADLARKFWRSGMDTCLTAALSEVQPASDGHLPASFGLVRSQSGSPEKFWKKVGNGRDVVVSAEMHQRREPDKACHNPRTPLL